MARIAAWMGASLLCACGPGEAAMPPDCDGASVPIYALERDEVVVEAAAMEDGAVLVLESFGSATAHDRYRVLAVAGCVAEPRTIVDGMDSVTSPPRAGLPWVSRSRDPARSTHWVFDPTRTDAARDLGEHVTFVDWVDRGLLVRRWNAATGRSDLVEIATAANGEWTETVVLADVADVAAPLGHAVERFVTIVTPEGQLGVLDVETRALENIRDGVAHATPLDHAARSIVVTYTSHALGDPAMVVLDRERGVEVVVGHPGWDGDGGSTKGDRFAVHDRELPTQFIFGPDARELWVPGSWTHYPHATADDGARMVSAPDGTRLLRSGSDAVDPDVIVGGHPEFHDGRFYVRHSGDDVLEVRRVDTDGSNIVELFDDDVGRALHLRNGDWSVLRDRDADGVGTLWRRDGDLGDEQHIDVDVAELVPESGISDPAIFYVRRGDDPNDRTLYRR